MAAQIPPLFRNGPLLSTKQISVYQTRLILQVVLSMSALCLLELDLPFAQAQPGTSSPPTSELSSRSDDKTPPEKQPPSTISELELIKEEEGVALKEESASIARGMYPGKPQPISQAPSNVYVVTDEEIRHSGAIDLPTILRRIPGIDVMQTTGADFNVAARGDNQLRANKMLVLVDGRSIFLDFQGEVLWKNIPITLPEIKRIEVLKGPAAALYGFNAFDGVINIITKSAAEMKGVTVQFGGGEFGTISSAAIVAGVINKFGYRLSYGHNQTNQWGNRDGLAFRNNLLNGQLEYAMHGDARFTLQGGLTDSNRYDGPVVDNVINSQKPSQRYVNAVYDRPNFFIRAYWTGTNQPATLLVNPALAPFLQLSGKDGTADNSTEANSYNLEMQHSVNVWSANRLTYGINYRHNAISGNFLDGYAREYRLGLYLQDEWRLTDTLTAVGGLRYDLDTFINPTVSPRFSLLYNPSDNHSFRAGVSVGYRPPTLFETRTLTNGIASFTLPFPPITIQSPTFLSGSPNLAPEQIISYDAGYQGWYWKHRMRLRADVFFNHISDLISITNTGPSTLSFANGGTQGTAGGGGGSADIYGFEVGAEAQLTTWLTAFANYTYQEIGQTYGLTNRVARGAPRHKVNAGAHLEFENGLSGDALLHYVSSATYPVDPSFVAIAGPPFNGPSAPDGRVPSYVLLNLRGAYRIWHEKKTGREAEIAVSAFNALNDNHKEHPLGEMLASRVMGWLTVRY